MNITDLSRILNKYDPGRIVFVGLGNSLRGDDLAGIYMLNKLRLTGLFKNALFIEAGTTPENYLSLILNRNPESVIFIDAAKFGGKPGEIKLIGTNEISGLSFSTHSYSMGMIDELIRMSCHAQIFYLGIEPMHTGISKNISLCIVDAVNNFMNAS